MNDGGEHDIPCKYINDFDGMVAKSMWRCVLNAITSCELYGDAQRIEFNLSGYIDTYYENDNIRWHGLSDEQVDRLKKAYKVRTAEKIYDIFLSQARKLMHYKEKEE